jgi:hypothetical protein
MYNCCVCGGDRPPCCDEEGKVYVVVGDWVVLGVVGARIGL